MAHRRRHAIELLSPPPPAASMAITTVVTMMMMMMMLAYSPGAYAATCADLLTTCTTPLTCCCDAMLFCRCCNPQLNEVCQADGSCLVDQTSTPSPTPLSTPTPTPTATLTLTNTPSDTPSTTLSPSSSASSSLSMSVSLSATRTAVPSSSSSSSSSSSASAPPSLSPLASSTASASASSAPTTTTTNTECSVLLDTQVFAALDPSACTNRSSTTSNTSIDVPLDVLIVPTNTTIHQVNVTHPVVIHGTLRMANASVLVIDYDALLSLNGSINDQALVRFDNRSSNLHIVDGASIVIKLVLYSAPPNGSEVVLIAAHADGSPAIVSTADGGELPADITFDVEPHFDEPCDRRTTAEPIMRNGNLMALFSVQDTCERAHRRRRRGLPPHIILSIVITGVFVICLPFVVCAKYGLCLIYMQRQADKDAERSRDQVVSEPLPPRVAMVVATVNGNGRVNTSKAPLAERHHHHHHQHRHYPHVGRQHHMANRGGDGVDTVVMASGSALAAAGVAGYGGYTF